MILIFISIQRRSCKKGDSCLNFYEKCSSGIFLNLFSFNILTDSSSSRIILGFLDLMDITAIFLSVRLSMLSMNRTCLVSISVYYLKEVPRNCNDGSVLSKFPDKEIEENLSKKSLERSLKFNWQKTALETSEFYKSLLS